MLLRGRCPSGSWEGIGEHPGVAQDGPKSAQEGSKRGQVALKMVPRDFPENQKAGPRAHPRTNPSISRICVLVYTGAAISRVGGAREYPGGPAGVSLRPSRHSPETLPRPPWAPTSKRHPLVQPKSLPRAPKSRPRLPQERPRELQEWQSASQNGPDRQSRELKRKPKRSSRGNSRFLQNHVPV